MTKIDDRLKELEQKKEKFLQMGGSAKAWKIKLLRTALYVVTG